MSAPAEELVHPSDLEPSRIGRRTYATRRRPVRLDAASLICGVLCLLMLIPAQLILPGTTDVGRPAIVLCLLLWVWWVVTRLNPRLTLSGPQPMRWAVLAMILSLLVSYSYGFLRGLTAMEANSADRWLLFMAAFFGMILTAADGIPSWLRLRTVLKVFVACATVMSVIGILQAMLAMDITEYLRIPGMDMKGFVPQLQDRGGALRVASTTLHYIELSAVLAMALPFAIHLALFAPTRRSRQRAIVQAIVIAACIPVTISRTGIVAVVIGLACLAPLWPWRFRYNVLWLSFVLLIGVALSKPSLARSLMEMFTNISDDPSITSRTEDYELVGYYFAQRPWLGRGTGTWVSPQYPYLDNQWLSTALCNGVVGVVALATLHIVALTLAAMALRRSTSREDKHLCAALIATQLIAIFVSATFDALWFSTYTTVLGLVIGLCGTVWRLTHPTPAVRTAAPPVAGG